VLRELPDESVHAIITDPPYGLEFMGASWDGQVPGVAYWQECLRVAKPGAHLVAFGGTRTFHRLAVSIEDAGWEMQDSIGMPTLLAWVQGQGFPKGKNKLKPAWEPIIVARKPLAGTVAANVLAHGTGGINVDACRVATSPTDAEAMKRANSPNSGRMKPGGGQLGTFVRSNPTGAMDTTQGRWPANVVLVHDASCRPPGACAARCPVAELDRQSGFRRSGERPAAKGIKSSPGQNGTMDRYWSGSRQEKREVLDEGGGASRFFPTFRYQAKAPARERPKIDGKGWPTVKPLALMRWLVRLVTPPGGVVLDVFAGTGPTLQAARDEGFDSIGIERDEFAYQLARQRLGLDDPEAAA
jgi:site-specific DNA-methyltransferase (adenine-specific)